MSRTVKSDQLPAIAHLRATLNVLTALDIVMLPQEDAWLRLHHRVGWPDPTVAVYHIDNGGGDHLFLVFTPDGCILKGFDHESPLSAHAREEYAIWPGIYDDTPPALLAVLDDPMFEREDVTFCLWQSTGEGQWRQGDVENSNEDGCDFLLVYLNGTAESYREWAESYYDAKLPLHALKAVYEGAPITAALIAALCPGRDAAAALAEIANSTGGYTA